MVEKQKSRFSKDELTVVKDAFCEKEEHLYTIRRILLQLEVPEKDETELKKVLSPELGKILRKTFLPTLEGGLPLQQEIDLWMTINVEGKSAEEAYPHIEARGVVINYMEAMLKKLSGVPTTINIKLTDLTEKNDTPVIRLANLIARNTIVQHVEMQLGMLRNLAGRKNETPEETMKRLQQDSMK